MIKNLLQKFFFLREKNQEENIEIRKFRLFSLVTVLGIVIFMIYGFLHIFIEKNIFMFVLTFSSGLIFLLNQIIFLKIKKINIPSLIEIIVCFFVFTAILIDGGFRNSSIIWITVFPIITYYFKGKYFGTISVLSLFFVAIVILCLSQIGLIKTPYSIDAYMGVFGVYTILSFIILFYEETFRKSEKIIWNFFSDSLTELPNRRQLIKDLKEKDKKDLTLILINVDEFKEINDLYGNKIGDLILIEIANRLKYFYNEKNIYRIYKLHADEFAIILQNNKSNIYLQKLLNQIHMLLSMDFSINDIEIALSVSMGIAESERDLLAETDMALKLAKETRKDYIIFNKSMKITEKIAQRYENNIKLLRVLKQGIASDRIVPFYQPIINNKTGKIEKYECLARLLGKNEFINPHDFLDIAKKAKMYTHITRIMILKAFNLFCNNNYEFTINLSIDDILNKDTMDFIISTLKFYNLSDRITFELIESDKMEENKEVQNFIYNMKKLGCRIAIDDFGSGYSNFEYILRLNIDYIKIDASLIKNIVFDKNSQVITQTIVDFSQRLNIKTIAEHVSNKNIFEKVKELNIDYSQGYYISEPLYEIRDDHYKKIAAL